MAILGTALLMGTGCDSTEAPSTKQKGAHTGKQVFDSWVRAVQKKDAAAWWELLSKRNHEVLIAAYREARERARHNDNEKLKLKEETGIEGDPTTIEPIDLAKASLRKALLQGDISTAKDFQFMREEASGDRIIVHLEVTIRGSRDQRKLLLVKEGEELRIDHLDGGPK